MSLLPVPFSERLPQESDLTRWPDDDGTKTPFGPGAKWCWLFRLSNGGWEISQCSVTPDDAEEAKFFIEEGYTHWMAAQALTPPNPLEECSDKYKCFNRQGCACVNFHGYPHPVIHCAWAALK